MVAVRGGRLSCLNAGVHGPSLDTIVVAREIFKLYPPESDATFQLLASTTWIVFPTSFDTQEAAKHLFHDLTVVSSPDALQRRRRASERRKDPLTTTTQ